MALVLRRPTGITILGTLVILASIGVFLIGLAGLIAGLAGLLTPILPAGVLLTGGIVYLVLGGFLFLSGVGLLRLRSWAWWLAVLTTLGVVGYSAYAVYQRGIADATWPTVTLAIGGVIFLYLLAVGRWFRRPVVGMPA